MAGVYAQGHTAQLDDERRRDLEKLHRVEDELIAEAVSRQLAIGLDVVTDGEFRRAAYSNSFYDAVEGLEPSPEPMRFFAPDGSYVEYAAPPIAVRRLRKIASPGALEASYLASITGHLFKNAFPAASRWCLPHTHRLGPGGPYADLEEFIAHAIAIQRELIAEAVAAGCRYVQLDFPVYPMLVDEDRVAQLRQGGVDPGRLLELALGADRAVLADLPEGVRTALHICRGNHRSRFLFRGSLEPIAEQVFQLPYDSFLVEWEDVEREGGYDPIRFLPPGRVLVMGLVSTKSARLESEDEVLRRLEEAGQFLPAEQLAISTQCGFASTWHGNEIDEGTQWRKLELVARVAERAWG
jgi:5-methyltetrahydropteroyltriglutamate--homocysteine methyltransferase